MLSLILTITVIFGIVALLRFFYKRQTNLESEDIKHILGSGNVVTVPFPLPPKDGLDSPILAFNALCSGASIDIRVVPSDDGTIKATITADDNLIDKFTSYSMAYHIGNKVLYNILCISNTSSIMWESLEKMYITLYVPIDSLYQVVNEGSYDMDLTQIHSLRDIKIFGSGNITLTNLQKSHDIKSDVNISSQGSGSITISHIDADSLQIESNSSGSISIDTVTVPNKCKVNQKGSGKIIIKEISSDTFDIEKSGSNKFVINKLFAMKNVEIFNSGAGNFYVDVFCETPSLTITCQSSGDVSIMSVKTDTTNSTQSGSGTVRYKNVTSKQFIATYQGSGNLSVTKLETDTLVVNASGTGNIDINGTVLQSSVHHTGPGKIKVPLVNPAGQN